MAPALTVVPDHMLPRRVRLPSDQLDLVPDRDLHIGHLVAKSVAEMIDQAKEVVTTQDD